MNEIAEEFASALGESLKYTQAFYINKSVIIKEKVLFVITNIHTDHMTLKFRLRGSLKKSKFLKIDEKIEMCGFDFIVKKISTRKIYLTKINIKEKHDAGTVEKKR